MIKENSYFEGKVKSLGFSSKESESSSVGVMAPGEYTFGTAAPERMTVVKGALTIKRVSDEEWVTFAAGEAFDVIGDSSFDLKVAVATAYLCEYL
jgi:purine/pyrimidine-nucleoside phosphorylase